MKVKEEFAKWLMDIGKYVATAVLISSFLGEFSQKWIIYGFGIALVIAFLLSGLFMLKTLNKK
jgi:ABC-type multidrug transport system permease subunit